MDDSFEPEKTETPNYQITDFWDSVSTVKVAYAVDTSERQSCRGIGVD